MRSNDLNLIYFYVYFEVFLGLKKYLKFVRLIVKGGLKPECIQTKYRRLVHITNG